jgi:hypothetical protein
VTGLRERNAAIVADFGAGLRGWALSDKYQLSRQRILQIVAQHVPGDRPIIASEPVGWPSWRRWPPDSFGKRCVCGRNKQDYRRRVCAKCAPLAALAWSLHACPPNVRVVS